MKLLACNFLRLVFTRPQRRRCSYSPTLRFRWIAQAELGVGASPLGLLGPCTVDVHSTGFSNDPRIHAIDFEAAPTVANVAELTAPAAPEVYVADISANCNAACRKQSAHHCQAVTQQYEDFKRG